MSIQSLHTITLHTTPDVRDLIKSDSNWHHIMQLIYNNLPTIKRTPRVQDISFWTIENCPDGTTVSCREDNDIPPILFHKFSFKLPSQKLYLCLNEVGGYTLMTPSEY